MKAGSTTRRSFWKGLLGSSLVGLLNATALKASKHTYKFRYILASCMYGKTGLAEILPEVHKIGAEHIDIWPERHGNQREQIEAMGHPRFIELLKQHQVKLGILTHYDLGPFRVENGLRNAKKFGGTMVICGSGGTSGLKDIELKTVVKQFFEKMKPQIAVAEELGITLGIENHGGTMLSSPDSLRWFGELAPSKNIGIALAPYHLPQDSRLLANLIKELDTCLVHFYVWQYGQGSHEMAKEQELQQLPGRGVLDFRTIVQALKEVNYQGWTEIFMHPYPRGVPILEPTAEVTAEINQARRYLESLLYEA